MSRTAAAHATDGSITAAEFGGIATRDAQRRVQQGRWERLHPGIYLVGGHRRTPEARIRAAWLPGGPYSVITGPAAAYCHRMLDHAPTTVELSVPARTSPRPRPGIRLRRRDLYDSDVRELDGIRLAAPPFAVLETAVALADGSAFLDPALQRHVRFPAVYRSFCRNMGRTGSSAAGRLLVAAADRADSAAERLLVRLLREADIDGWVLGHALGPYRIDLAFPARRSDRGGPGNARSSRMIDTSVT